MQRLLVALIALIVSAAPAIAGEEDSHDLRILTFNVLAPIWAAPVWYPAEMDPALLDRTLRRERIVSFLRKVRRNSDVICLQEVQKDELPYFLRALGTEFEGAMAFNDPNYWSSWIVPELPWQPNGTAVIVRKSVVAQRRFTDLALSSDGNHAAAVEGLHAATGRPLRIFSVHLDSDFNNNRLFELRSLMEQAPAHEGYTDVVCGDINEDTVTGSAGSIFADNGYADVLASVGNREGTHPWSTAYYRSARWAIIDHIMVRGAKPVAGDVFDFGLWSIANELTRIEENFRQSGSDHFPVGGTIRFY
ncbi:MAG: endonuclease/exonuclease/phosphatase family protein [Burkholderiales bacterium]